MPVAYEVLEQGRFIVTVAEGHITKEDLVEHIRNFVSDQRIKAGHRELVDLTKAVSTDVTASVVGSVVTLELDIELLEGSKMAIVAESDFQYGMSRIYAALSEEIPGRAVMVFRDHEQARGWLGIPRDEA